MDFPAAYDVQRFAELTPAGYPSPGFTTAIVYCVVPGIFISVIALALVRAFGQLRRRRSLAASAITVVEGTVEAPDGAPPVEVTIVQSGRQSKGTYQWKEVRRMATARPFHVRIDDGSLVRVDPADSVTLMCPLDEVDRAPRRRTLRTALASGARAYVVGQLEKGVDPHAERGYRAAPDAAVLRPPPGGKMLIAREHPARIFSASAGYDLKWVLALLAAFALDQLWFSGYFERSVHGAVVWGRTTERRAWMTEGYSRYGAYHEHHSAITVATSDGRQIADEIAFDDYVTIGQGDLVPFIVVAGRPDASQIGESASAHALLGVGAILTALIGALSYLSKSAGTRPWYEKDRIDHYGRGTLEGSP